jgi:hypothetical protein
MSDCDRSVVHCVGIVDLSKQKLHLVSELVDCQPAENKMQVLCVNSYVSRTTVLLVAVVNHR